MGGIKQKHMSGALLLYQHYITCIYICICTFCMMTICIYISYATPCWACWAVQDFVENRLRTWSYVCFKNKPYIHGLITIFHSKMAFFRCLPFSKAVKCGLSSRTPVMQSTSSYKKPPRRLNLTLPVFWGTQRGTQKIPWKSLQGTPWIPKALVEAQTSKKVYTHMCERTALETWLL